MLRSFSDMLFATLRVMICGSEKLADLKYAQGTLSMLNHAEVREWPELSVADVQALQAQAFPGTELPDEEAALVLRASGGHPRLLGECLEHRHKRGALDEPGYRDLLVKSPIAFQAFAPFKHHPEAVARLCSWLAQDDLGPAEPLSFQRPIARAVLEESASRRLRTAALALSGAAGRRQENPGVRLAVKPFNLTMSH